MKSSFCTAIALVSLESACLDMKKDLCNRVAGGHYAKDEKEIDMRMVRMSLSNIKAAVRCLEQEINL